MDQEEAASEAAGEDGERRLAVAVFDDVMDDADAAFTAVNPEAVAMAEPVVTVEAVLVAPRWPVGVVRASYAWLGV